jgi:short-subunit dehydrogenase
MQSRRRGHIVNVSSFGGIVPVPGQGAYVATKYALVGLSETLWIELAPFGVGVSVVCPSAVRTQLWRTSRVVQNVPPLDRPPATGSGSADGMDPREVGRRVVRGIRDNRLFIVTHGDLRDVVARRNARLLAAFDEASADTAILAEPQARQSIC